MKKQRNQLSNLLILAISLVLLTSMGRSSSQTAPSTTHNKQGAAKTNTLRLGIISINNAKIPTGPTGWAIRQGKLLPELRKLGITEVKTFSFPNGPNLNEALVAGQLDVGIYGDTPALVAKANGMPTRLISQEQVGMNAWLLAKKNGVRSVAELKGQKVATSKGSYMHRYLMGLLQKTGLQNQVTVVHLLPNEAQAALQRGDVAAIAASTGTGPLLRKKGFPVIDEASKHPNLRGTSVTVATEAFLAQYPKLPHTWNQVKLASVKSIKANPEAYYQFHSQVSGYPVDVVKDSFPIKQFPEEPFPKQGLALLEGTKQFLVSQKLTRSDFKINDWVALQQ
jgi:sulfonate transport system substrate-binding protein